VAQAFGSNVAPHKHAIFVQRRAGGAFRDGNLLETRVVRLEKALALAVHPNPARNQIRRARADVTIAFDARGFAGLLQLAQNAAAQRLFDRAGFRRTMIEMTRELDD
jgi:hypothetical protein